MFLTFGQGPASTWTRTDKLNTYMNKCLSNTISTRNLGTPVDDL